MNKFNIIVSLIIAFVVFLVPSSTKASFPVLLDGTLVKGSGPEVYFMENGMKRWIVNPDIFSEFEFDWYKINIVSDTNLNRYPRGNVLDVFRSYPEGALLRERGDAKIYIMERGYRRWIKDAQSFNNLGLSWGAVFDISEDKIKRIRESSPIEKEEKISRPGTVLKYTPEKIVEDVYAEFEFTATPAIRDMKNVRFETFLEGMDKRWNTTSGRLRNIKLPIKSGKYSFFVRARYTDGGVDLVPEKYEFTVKISPLFGDVKVSSTRVRQKNIADEYIYLTNYTKIPLSITGWTIESEKDKTRYKIPQVYEIPKYAYNQNLVNVNLNPRAYAIVYSGENSLGVGFRTNKCTGYLNEDSDSRPALSKKCPSPDKEEVQGFNLYCQNKINRTPKCGEPDFNDTKLTNECRAFLRESFGYGACVTANREFYDFFENEWRVYLKRSKSIWNNTQDEIILRDRNGLVVDRRSY